MVTFPKQAIYTAEGVKLLNKPVTRTLPSSSLVDHTSQTQLIDWQDHWHDMFDTWARCFGFEVTEEHWRDFLAKFHHFSSDHAADQNRLFELFFDWKTMIDRTMRGETELLDMSADELLDVMAKHTLSQQPEQDSKPWADMSDDEKATHRAASWRNMCMQAGEEAFKRLTPKEQHRINRFFHPGCWNHKSINAFKKGTQGVITMWSDFGISGPVPLVNKGNTAALGGSCQAQVERILKNAQAGGIALTNIAGRQISPIGGAHID
jgi:hypothetical protein